VSESSGRVERDRRRFDAIVRGQIKHDLEAYVSGSEMIGCKGGQLVSIPLPRIELPRLRFGSNSEEGGGGERAGEAGDGPGEEAGVGSAGNAPGEHMLEVELTLEEMAAILGEELELPNIEPRGKAQVAVSGHRYSSVSRSGPRSLRHMRRTMKEALIRQISTGTYDPDDPRLVPIAEDLRFRSAKEVSKPDHAAMILYMMDVSGSMGREQKEIVRLVSFWIDSWLRSQYKSLETRYLVHDASAKEVDHDTFYRLRESGGTKISSAYEMAAQMLVDEFPPEEWNIYLFHFSDGDNWSGRDTEKCLSILREQLLPAANLFCYGQVKSAYGSGQFMKDLAEGLEPQEGLISCEILDRQGILPAIKTFLGSGR